jgi:uncharacterized protein (DUF1697 family)
MTAVSLLRGINVGGHRTVPMAALKSLHERLGLEEVRTYLNSGNVVFQSSVTSLAGLAGRIEGALEKTFGFQVRALVRTASELDGLLQGNPFKAGLSNPSHLLVMFLEDEPLKARIEDLRRSLSGPEKLHFCGREAYLSYPNGIGRSKLTNAFIEKKLNVAGTARNWNVVTRLHQMMNLSAGATTATTG